MQMSCCYITSCLIPFVHRRPKTKKKRQTSKRMAGGFGIRRYWNTIQPNQTARNQRRKKNILTTFIFPFFFFFLKSIFGHLLRPICSQLNGRRADACPASFYRSPFSFFFFFYFFSRRLNQICHDKNVLLRFLPSETKKEKKEDSPPKHIVDSEVICVHIESVFGGRGRRPVLSWLFLLCIVTRTYISSYFIFQIVYVYLCPCFNRLSRHRLVMSFRPIRG